MKFNRSFTSKKSGINTFFSRAGALTFSLLICLSATCVLWPTLSPSPAPTTTADWPIVDETIRNENIKFTPEVLNGHTFYSTTLGEYPQTYVGNSLNTALENEYQRAQKIEWHNFTETYPNMSLSLFYTYMGEYPQSTAENQELLESEYQKMLSGQPSRLKTTGKIYHTYPAYYVTNLSSAGYYCSYNLNEEYELDGEKFVRFLGFINSSLEKVVWYKVEPIKWWVLDGTDINSVTSKREVKVISELCLTGPVPFSESSGDNLWSGSYIESWCNHNFFQETGLQRYQDTLIKKETLQNNTEDDYDEYDFPKADGNGIETQDYIYLPSGWELYYKYDLFSNAVGHTGDSFHMFNYYLYNSIWLSFETLSGSKEYNFDGTTTRYSDFARAWRGISPSFGGSDAFMITRSAYKDGKILAWSQQTTYQTDDSLGCPVNYVRPCMTLIYDPSASSAASTLQPTGNVYAHPEKINFYDTTSFPNLAYSYKYTVDSNEYVRIEANNYMGSDTTFTTGDSIGSTGDHLWFKVEPIKWWVVDGTNPKSVTGSHEIKVMSDIGLVAGLSYMSGSTIIPSWESSRIRTYLNQDFIFGSKLSNHRDIIKNETVGNNKDGDYANETSDTTGTPTNDYIYFPSYYEMDAKFAPETDTEGKFYLSSHSTSRDMSRLCSPSDYALSNYAYLSTENSTSYRDGVCNYFTRSNGRRGGNVYGVFWRGTLGIFTTVTANIQDPSKYMCVRPMMTLLYNVTTTQVSGPAPLESVVTTDPNDPDIYRDAEGLVYHIKSFKGLNMLSDYSHASGKFANKTFYLDNDIDCTGKAFKYIKTFDGIFNGNFHNIINLVPVAYDDPSDSSSTTEACFVKTLDGGTIQNVNFLGNDLAANYVALIIQVQGKSTLKYVYREGRTLGGNESSSFIYRCFRTQLTIDHCSVASTFVGQSRLQFNMGLIYSLGAASNVTVQNCYVIGQNSVGFAPSIIDTNVYDSTASLTIQASYYADSTANKYMYWSGTFDLAEWALNQNIHYDENVGNGLPFFKSRLIIGDKLDPLSSSALEQYFAKSPWEKMASNTGGHALFN